MPSKNVVRNPTAANDKIASIDKKLVAADITLAELFAATISTKDIIYAAGANASGALKVAGYTIINMPSLANIPSTGIKIIIGASALIAGPILYAIEYKMIDRVYLPIYRKFAGLLRNRPD